MLTVVPDPPAALPTGGPSPPLLDQIVREGARQMLAAARDLSAVDYVYLWADGIHLGIRLKEDKLCLLVMIGVRAGGRKELAALAGGYRESAGSWAGPLRDAARRGMRAPVLAIGDAALGFWSAVREMFPETTEQRIESARRRWRMVNAPHLVALVRAGATFINGQLAERTDHRHAAGLPTGAAA